MKIGILALAFAAVGATASPEKAVPRVIFHTIAGDLVFALYPTVAPRTVEQFLTLNRAGVYDTTHFRRLEPGFVLQTGTAEDRTIPLNITQKALIHKLPCECAPGVRHRRGVLSLARPDDDPNGGETSFSILLGDAPHLASIACCLIETCELRAGLLFDLPCRGDEAAGIARSHVVARDVERSWRDVRDMCAPAEQDRGYAGHAASGEGVQDEFAGLREPSNEGHDRLIRNLGGIGVDVVNEGVLPRSDVGRQRL